MDTSDKIITFNSISELEAAIIADSNSRDILAQRYCVRFIMLNSFEVFRELTLFLTKHIGVEIVDLEDRTFGPDKTLSIDSLLKIVKGLETTSLITPFSELVRFFPEEQFNGFFNEVILTEDIQNPQKRIYIPIIGLQNRFNDFLKNFGRVLESAPIWQYNAPQDDRVMVYVSKFTNFDIPEHLQICSLPTMRDWLKFWKRQAPQDKILCGARPIRFGWKYSRPDSIFTFQPVDNAHEFITEFLEIHIPIEYQFSDNTYWEILLSKITDNTNISFSFRNFVEDSFNRKNLSTLEILSLWTKQNTDSFGRWLLKHYALTQKVFKDSPYLSLVLSETDNLLNPETLFVNITERILYFTTPAEMEKYYEDRKQIMIQNREKMRTLVPKERQDWLETRIREYAQQDLHFKTAKRLCTSTFEFEKKFFLGWFIHREEFTLADVEKSYPDLAGYLKDPTFDAITPSYPWHREYFKRYRTAKIKDQYTKDLHEALTEKNKNADSFYEWFYSFQESHELLADLIEDDLNSPDKIYWIDGLGAEFIPYILYIIGKSKTGFETIHAEVARTTIPSNTTINTFNSKSIDIIKLSNLDDFAHDGHYKPLESLITELEIVKKLINRILEDNKVGNHTIAIVSDHGLSAMVRKRESLKLNLKTKHEGRYARLEEGENAQHDDNFVIELNPRDNRRYLVALNHSSLGTKPTHEVHGGATPEEVLVPFIVVTNNDLNKPIHYSINPSESSIPISSSVIEFSIMPEPKSAMVTVGDRTYQLVRNNMKWKALIENANEGMQTVCVTPFRGKPQEFKIEFYGMGFNSSFFDDDDF